MNRYRTIAVVLALLLLASLACNWVLWRKAHDAAAPVAAPAATAGAQNLPPRDSGTKAAYDIVANPEMKGRLGRVVLTFAEEGNIKETRTAFNKTGGADLIRVDYGIVAAELPPGDYDLEVSGEKIARIPVESGKDTRVHSGVLRLHGSKETRFTIHEPGAEKSFHVAYGNAEFGLPVGEYEVEISGQREKVTIEAGKVTDF